MDPAKIVRQQKKVQREAGRLLKGAGTCLQERHFKGGKMWNTQRLHRDCMELATTSTVTNSSQTQRQAEGHKANCKVVVGGTSELNWISLGSCDLPTPRVFSCHFLTEAQPKKLSFLASSGTCIRKKWHGSASKVMHHDITDQLNRLYIYEDYNKTESKSHQEVCLAKEREEVNICTLLSR